MNGKEPTTEASAGLGGRSGSRTLATLPGGRPGTARPTIRFVESLDLLSRVDWDHEPLWKISGAGVSPALWAHGRDARATTG